MDAHSFPQWWKSIYLNLFFYQWCSSTSCTSYSSHHLYNNVNQTSWSPPLLKPYNLWAVSEVPPLYKHTLTPPCCHSTEQCTSAEHEEKHCTNIQTLKHKQCDWWDGEPGAGQEGKWSHCWVTVSSLAVTRSPLNSRYTRTHKKSSELTHRACRWTLCSFPRLSSLWKLRRSVFPSDAWPAWTWPSDYLKHTH